MNVRVAGLDIGKVSAHIAILEEKPKDLKRFARSYRPTLVKADAEGIEKLLALPADLFVLEPTGHYSYIWIEALKRSGRDYRLVSSRRVRHFCEYNGLINKADRPDAAGIAAYTLENLDNEQAFLKLERLKIRELYLQLNSTVRAKNPVENRLGQRLTFELPEAIKRFEDCSREWLDSNPPAIYRYLAGEPLSGPYSAKRAELYGNTIGQGASAHTRSLAQQLINFEMMEYQLEVEIEAELSKPYFEPYHKIFDRFEIPKRTRAAILSRIYPFEDFLRDGKPFKEYVRGTDSHRRSQMTKRDRSEGEFKLCLGMGKELHQSGSQTSWKAGGAKYARTALWQFVKMMVVVRRSKTCNFSDAAGALEKKFRKEGVSPWLNTELIQAVAELTGSTEEMASLRLHYEFQTDKKGDRRVSATAGRFCRMLYKALLMEFAVKS